MKSVTVSAEDEIRERLADGRLVQDGFARMVTLTLGPSPSAVPPEEGEIWTLAGVPFIVRDVSTSGGTSTAKLFHLQEAGAPAEP